MIQTRQINSHFHGLSDHHLIELVSPNDASINENTVTQELLVYPNPANSILNIDTKGERILAVRIFNISGQLIESRNYKNTSLIKMELNKPKGIYLLEVTSKNQKAVFKLMVE